MAISIAIVAIDPHPTLISKSLARGRLTWQRNVIFYYDPTPGMSGNFDQDFCLAILCDGMSIQLHVRQEVHG